MIKINGLNYKNGSGDSYLFGYLHGNGTGKGMDFWYFSNSFGNKSGDGYNFGDGNGDGEYFSHNLLIGDGGSFTPYDLKLGFLKK